MQTMSAMEAIQALTVHSPQTIRSLKADLVDDMMRVVNAIAIASLENDDDLQDTVDGYMARMKVKIDWSIK